MTTKANLQANDLPFFTWIGTIPSSPLPIKLLFFKVKDVDENGINLEWATTMEENFDKFLVERADDKLNWEVIAEIDGRGGLDITTTYSFLHKTPTAGKNYYRLKSVDYDRTFEYSNIIFAQWNFKTQQPEVSVYPNPIVNHEFTLEVNHEISSSSKLVLVNSVGKEIFRQSIPSNKELITLPDDLKPGIYFLNIIGGDHNTTIKVMIR